MKKSVFLLLLGAVLANAEQITSINFKGLVHLSPETAKEIMGLKVGDELNVDSTDRAIAKLFRQGYFDDIYIENKGGDVTVTVKEKPSIARIDIKGVVTNDKTAIDGLINIKQGNMYDELAIERAKERIRQYYESKGYFDTVIDVTKEPVAGNESSLFVTMNINRGENIIIENVNLVGAKLFDYDDVEPVVANKEREFMGWMWGRNDGKVKLFELPNDPARIQDKYYQKGYLDATVSNPYLNAYMDNYTADLTYYVTEGEQYRVSSVDIEAPEFLELDKEKILKDFRLESGDVMNSARLRQDMKKLDDIVADKGYAFVRINPKTEKNVEDKTVSIVYEVVPDEKVYIRNVQISGNDRTVDRVVRRELYLTEGNLYSRTDLQDSKDALKRTSYFDEVEIEEQRVGANQVDLLVKVKEASTGSISGGIGYGSSDGLLLNASVSDTNVFGSGMKGVISVDRSDNELSGQIGLTNPRLFDSEYSLGGTLYANDYSWNNYDEKSYGLNVVVGRKLTRNLSASLGYIIEQSRISGLSDVLKTVGYKDGKSLKSSLIPSITYNSTDDYYLPRTGIIASTSLEFAGVGGDEKFLKSRTNFNWYQGIREWVDYDLIFRFKSSFGKIWDRGWVPINERLYLGGIRNLRGFESRTVSPKVKVASGSWYETGGDTSFNSSAELSFPLIERVKMRGVLFVDYGVIRGRIANVTAPGIVDYVDGRISRYSAGAGIEWVTPMGPLQLIFAKPLKKQDGDDTSTFEFTIGQRF
ncbi:beta-barrel assembly machinery complex, BamA/YaeT protein [Campylobacter showae]|uniref:Outer membrane protein assembly factor BamA n=1 Tax=Campylobacter showae RM3277 TaxID=553219 RepID=C6REK3_9BACT|nr:outer membrane protein assembly factor BamA [Campylobacter showae]EET80379.1 outer membrane protein assembly complex, YaeT protein [Campylobacter showae RM3277]QCD48359.1 beta-barrel assembly machinery complex, BamA/YaeT protein [Campylobacter showae]